MTDFALTFNLRLLCVYIGWTISYRYAIAGVVFDEEGEVVRQKNKAASNATLFFILAYSPAYNIGYNALTYSKRTPTPSPQALSVMMLRLLTAYLVELWPFALRSRGITFFQFFGRKYSRISAHGNRNPLTRLISAGLATFFNTFVNPIALADIQWKYLITYVCWLAYEVVFVYFFFPETHGRTLEELAWRKLTPFSSKARSCCAD